MRRRAGVCVVCLQCRRHRPRLQEHYAAAFAHRRLRRGRCRELITARRHSAKGEHCRARQFAGDVHFGQRRGDDRIKRRRLNHRDGEDDCLRSEVLRAECRRRREQARSRGDGQAELARVEAVRRRLRRSQGRDAPNARRNIGNCRIVENRFVARRHSEHRGVVLRADGVRDCQRGAWREVHARDADGELADDIRRYCHRRRGRAAFKGVVNKQSRRLQARFDKARFAVCQDRRRRHRQRAELITSQPAARAQQRRALVQCHRRGDALRERERKCRRVGDDEHRHRQHGVADKQRRPERARRRPSGDVEDGIGGAQQAQAVCHAVGRRRIADVPRCHQRAARGVDRDREPRLRQRRNVCAAVRDCEHGARRRRVVICSVRRVAVGHGEVQGRIALVVKPDIQHGDIALGDAHARRCAVLVSDIAGVKVNEVDGH